MSSWSKVWDVEGVTSLAVLPNGVCSWSAVDSSLVVALCFLLSHTLSKVHLRQKQLEVESRKGDFVSTKRHWTPPKSCGSQSSEWEERKKSKVGSGSLCEPRTPTSDTLLKCVCLFFFKATGTESACAVAWRQREEGSGWHGLRVVPPKLQTSASVATHARDPSWRE